jgi:tetratricopeptide (TPR) repeat protein
VLSREVGDRELEARILNSLGLSHGALGDFQRRLDFYEKSKTLSEEIDDKSTLHMALSNIATHYFNQGRFAESLDYFIAV